MSTFAFVQLFLKPQLSKTYLLTYFDNQRLSLAPAKHVTMTSSAVTLKPYAHHTVRRSADRRPTNDAVSIDGTAPVSYRRAHFNDHDNRRFTRSKTAIGDFSSERPVAHRMITRTSWRMSAASSPTSGSDSSLVEPPIHLQPLSLQLSSVDPAGSGTSSRVSSAADRSSRVSPSDIIRLADDNLDRHRAAAARRRFVLMSVGRTSRLVRWKSPSTSAAFAGDMEDSLELCPSSSSLRTVPDIDDDRLAQPSFSGLLRSA